MNGQRTAMLDLEIRYGDGQAEVRQISKSQPVSIGRHGSNDICIDEPDVAPIHCRVIWNKGKTYFEVASANRDGVDLNGTLVRVSSLKGGDVLRIGSADLVVREHRAAAHEPAGASRGRMSSGLSTPRFCLRPPLPTTANRPKSSLSPSRKRRLPVAKDGIEGCFVPRRGEITVPNQGMMTLRSGHRLRSIRLRREARPRKAIRQQGKALRRRSERMRASRSRTCRWRSGNDRGKALPKSRSRFACRSDSAKDSTSAPANRRRSGRPSSWECSA